MENGTSKAIGVGRLRKMLARLVESVENGDFWAQCGGVDGGRAAHIGMPRP
jgi:hypothetical protein